MRKLRARVIAVMMTIVGRSCTISVSITVMSMNGFFEGRTIEKVVMGMAVRDVILILLVLVLLLGVEQTVLPHQQHDEQHRHQYE